MKPLNRLRSTQPCLMLHQHWPLQTEQGASYRVPCTRSQTVIVCWTYTRTNISTGLYNLSTGFNQYALHPLTDFALLLDANDELQGSAQLRDALHKELLSHTPDDLLLKGAYMLNQYLWWPTGTNVEYMRVKIVVPRSGWRYNCGFCIFYPVRHCAFISCWATGSGVPSCHLRMLVVITAH